MDAPSLPDFDDEPTVIRVRDDETHQPPPLPFPLRRAKSTPDPEDWLAELPEEARRILEAARHPAESWPRSPRIPGAVATPLTRIPSLVRHA